MKKFVAGCLVSLVILVLVVIGVVAWAFKAGAKEQEKFFAAVYSGDPQQVLALFDPRLIEEVDEPVIAEWMNAMKETLGEPEGLKASSFNTLCTVRPYLRQCTPPAFSATLPPIEQAIWDEGSGA